MANFGPRSDVQVICEVAGNSAAYMGVEYDWVSLENLLVKSVESRLEECRKLGINISGSADSARQPVHSVFSHDIFCEVQWQQLCHKCPKVWSVGFAAQLRMMCILIVGLVQR